MKFAFCLFRYYPYGGLERDFLRVVKECLDRGHEVTVFTMAWEGEVPCGASLVLLPVTALTNHKRCLKFAKRLGEHLQTSDFNCVVGFNRMPHCDVYYAADICFAAKSHNRFWYRFTPRYRTYIQLEQAVFAAEAKTKILLLSAPEQKHFQHYYGTPAERFVLLPPGIDKNRINCFDRKSVRSQLCTEFNVAEDTFLLLMVGSDFKRKGVDRALYALADLPDELRQKTRLWIVGEGKKTPLLQLAQKLGIAAHVLFLGGRQDVGRFMVAADVLLHPAYHETAGMVLLEALVAPCPVLVTENCGYAFHIAQAKAGLIVPMPYQQKSLNDYLRCMLSHEAQALWRENAKNYAQNTDLYSLPQKAADLLEQWGHSSITINPELLNCQNPCLFQQLLTLKGKIFRHEKNRKTLRFESNGQGYFLKLHQGVGWKEIFKNLLQGRLPVLGAEQEWRAIMRLQELNIATMQLVGYGKKGWNPARLLSFVITQELTHTVSLEDYCGQWLTHPPSLKLKRALIAKVAKIAAVMHQHGINHRDFYLCHFLLAHPDKLDLNALPLYLIDLHRVQLRSKTPLRWIIKDLAGLYFSSMDIGLTQRDVWYFIKQYSNRRLVEVKQDQWLWQKVNMRAKKLYAKIHKAFPQGSSPRLRGEVRRGGSGSKTHARN